MGFKILLAVMKPPVKDPSESKPRNNVGQIMLFSGQSRERDQSTPNKKDPKGQHSRLL
jgi:hypothetical protein